MRMRLVREPIVCLRVSLSVDKQKDSNCTANAALAPPSLSLISRPHPISIAHSRTLPDYVTQPEAMVASAWKARWDDDDDD